MDLVFVALESDTLACRSLELLSGYGRTLRVTGRNDTIEPHSIALFSVEQATRNKFLRLSAHRMPEEEIRVPEWAAHLPFTVAINTRNCESDRFNGLSVALRTMAEEYKSWGPWMRSPEAPWRPNWKGGKKHGGFDAWRAKAKAAAGDAACIERLRHRLSPIFVPRGVEEIRTLIVTGCALFNQPHTDVISVLPRSKVRTVVRTLEHIVAESGVSDVRFVVPRGDLLREEFRDHFHPFIFMSIEDAEKRSGKKFGAFSRILGKAHAHARSDVEISSALDLSAEALIREIVRPLSEKTGVAIAGVSWTDYIGPYIERGHALAEKYRAFAEAIYRERVRTRPSYASLHAIDPERGLRRTISNNAFYIAEAMFLKENPTVAIVNCEFADTFWKGLEQVLTDDVWGEFRPFIGMVPESARQPWGY